VTNRIGTEAQIETQYATFGEFLSFADERGRTHRGRNADVSMLAMFCFAIRRDVYETVGPLDEGYGLGLLEDDDYVARLHRAGYRLTCAQDVFVHHFGEASFGDLYQSGEYHRLLGENQARYASKWGTPWQPYARGQMDRYEGLVAATRRAVQDSVPPGSTVLVVSRGDERMMQVKDRVVWHFPRDADGVWAGHYPADGDAAVSLLQDQIAAGAGYLVIPETGRWWLQFYEGLERYLEEDATMVRADEICRIFKLAEPVTAARSVSRPERKEAQT
jgi:hypothetical protein